MDRRVPHPPRHVIEPLLWATPLGLLIDIAGFILIVRHGHALFMLSGAEVPSGPDTEGKDGDLFFVIPGDTGKAERESRRRRRWAHVGVYVVVTGFGLQIVGAIAAICLAM